MIRYTLLMLVIALAVIAIYTMLLVLFDDKCEVIRLDPINYFRFAPC